MSEEEKTLKYLSAMRIIDFNELGFVYGKETITEILNLIQSQQKEIEKKDKIIDEMAPQIYLDKQQREEMRKYIYESNRSKDFTSFVKQYFEKKVEGKQ